MFLVVRDGQAFPSPTRVHGLQARNRWNLGATFPRRESAIDAAQGWLQDYPGEHLDVVEGFNQLDIEQQLRSYDTANVVWCSNNPDYAGGAWPPDERSGMQHDGQKLPQPINVDKEQLVGRLQSQLEEEQAERQKTEDKERQARLGVDQFVTDHQDEIVEYLGRNFGGSWRQVEERLAEVFKDDAYKPSKLKKGRKETDLEKMVRVLAMSVDKTIEVQPTSPIYDLL